ncbi:MAG: 5-methyltetrahydropteroyltriglutamate--homocysteine S-methyltransferase [Chloroflexi bacterium]|nr:5-methyltetrahydropteroyltriglutamate--homocysteine S-methyltransferase [Chloroflexota bacterium]
MIRSLSLGYPRIGPKRELKRAVERYWSGRLSADELRDKAAELRRYVWESHRDAGIDLIPSNDFTLYDQVLATTEMVGAVPERFRSLAGLSPLDVYFAMARGYQGPQGDVHACDLTKWFDTNYHYVVPELARDQEFALDSTKPRSEFAEALALGIKTTPVLIGPVTYLLLSKSVDDSNPLDLLDKLLPVYDELLRELDRDGVDQVQLHEPVLVTDLDPAAADAFRTAYRRLAAAGPSIVLGTYFGALNENLSLLDGLSLGTLHVDLVRAPDQLEPAVAAAKANGWSLSLGLVDGRNVWRADLDRVRERAGVAVAELGAERVLIASSCSLLHCPVDLDNETGLDEELKQWMAFARQKLGEIAAVAGSMNGRPGHEETFAGARAAQRSRASSGRIHNAAVAERLAGITEDMVRRRSPYLVRSGAQRDHLNLRPLPTTTIGSFPQSGQVRRERQAYRRGRQSLAQYEEFLRSEIARTIRIQEELDIDVLVHGEFERTDMVEYFGEQLEGITFTGNGWVQSYGTRCVRPPLIFGDVWRPEPMTTRWSEYAQSLTKRPVKGMLTAPVTILMWSFVRDDQPRERTCQQLALALRDEVADLEAAGISVIQLDEPALREGLPLRAAEHADYLRWAVECFRLASSGAADSTQIHTHMCYSEFNNIIEAIAALDADVISIEASRSNMELLESFVEFDYPNEIGPGVYDIHSPRIPSTDEMERRLQAALEHLRPEQLWVNPDCGLKTRSWEEVEPALRNMVAATERLRQLQATPA